MKNLWPRHPSPQTICSICRRIDVQAINHDLLDAGMTLKQVAQKYGLSLATCGRHRLRHLSPSNRVLLLWPDGKLFVHGSLFFDGMSGTEENQPITPAEVLASDFLVAIEYDLPPSPRVPKPTAETPANAN